MRNWLSDIGFRTRSLMVGMGYGARLFVRLLLSLPGSLRRFGLGLSRAPLVIVHLRTVGLEGVVVIAHAFKTGSR